MMEQKKDKQQGLEEKVSRKIPRYSCVEDIMWEEYMERKEREEEEIRESIEFVQLYRFVPKQQ